MCSLKAVKTTKKIGHEKFTFNQEQLKVDVLSFWQWSASELLGNAQRGILAEFIVASTIDALKKPREEWDAYDLLTNKGLKIEVKSSSYLQSWRQDRLSKIIFGIQPTLVWEGMNKWSKQPQRQADIYVFCVLSHKDKNTVAPLDLNQWDFYILNTDVLNEKKLDQKTITLSSLKKLHPLKLKYDTLGKEILNIEATIL